MSFYISLSLSIPCDACVSVPVGFAAKAKAVVFVSFVSSGKIVFMSQSRFRLGPRCWSDQKRKIFESSLLKVKCPEAEAEAYIPDSSLPHFETCRTVCLDIDLFAWSMLGH